MKDVDSFDALFTSLTATRKKFEKMVVPKMKPLVAAVNLYFEILGLISVVSKKTDSEQHSVMVFAIAFRRLLSSFVLLESGLTQEARMVLRNELELILIGIDITYNPISLKKWGESENDKLDSSGDWYFSKSSICKRIIKNEQGLYPKLEVVAAKDACREWVKISNEIAHAHSRVQFKDLVDDKGKFRLLETQTSKGCDATLMVYRRHLMNVIKLLLGIQEYRKRISDNPELAQRRNIFALKYEKIDQEMERVVSGRKF